MIAEKTLKAQALSRELRQGSGEFLPQRRAIVGLSMVSTLSMFQYPQTGQETTMPVAAPASVTGYMTDLKRSSGVALGKLINTSNKEEALHGSAKAAS
jgi:hypothetical protein